MSTKVTKASGETTDFDPKLLRRSLHRAGADERTIDRIQRKVEENLYDGIPTKKIYKEAFKILKGISRASAAKYKLKDAIIDLGPSGFPFEKYVAEILKFQDFKTEVGKIVNGHCIQHEVDVVAHKGSQYSVVECKFHNRHGYKCDVKVPLYVHSRFRDIERAWRKDDKKGNFSYKGWVFTNTHFSDDAINYSKCTDLELVGWSYPKHGSLRERIDLAGLHPVTALTGLNSKQTQELLDRDIVLCRHLKAQIGVLDQLQLSDKRKEEVEEECKELCIQHDPWLEK